MICATAVTCLINLIYNSLPAVNSVNQQGPLVNTNSLQKWTHFQKLLAGKPCCFKKKLCLLITKKEGSSIAITSRTASVPETEVDSSVVSSGLKLIFDFQSQQSEAWISSLFSLHYWRELSNRRKEERQEERETGEEAMFCRLPSLCRRLATAAILGACFAWGVEREEWLCHGTAKWEMTRFPQTWRLIGLLWIS